MCTQFTSLITFHLSAACARSAAQCSAFGRRRDARRARTKPWIILSSFGDWASPSPAASSPHSHFSFRCRQLLCRELPDTNARNKRGPLCKQPTRVYGLYTSPRLHRWFDGLIGEIGQRNTVTACLSPAGRTRIESASSSGLQTSQEEGVASPGGPTVERGAMVEKQCLQLLSGILIFIGCSGGVILDSNIGEYIQF